MERTEQEKALIYSVIIYSHTLTSRLQYVVDFLSQYYHTPIKLICDEEKYLVHPDPHKINYSYHRLLQNEIWIHSHVLLFESTIRPVKVECFDLRGKRAFFKTEGDTGFDLFAGIFFLLSRYEEYLPHQVDAYGRYAHQSSLAFKEGFLHLPLVNLWLEDFRNLLTTHFPDLQLPAPEFCFQPTYDIDIAWSYRNKGFKRNAGAIAKLFLTGKWKSMVYRIRVIRGKRRDPFDAYEWMDDLHHQLGLKPLYFFLVAQQQGRYDRNIDVQSPAFLDLVRQTAASYTIGLHPSWASSDHPAFLPKEKSWLEKVAEQTITASRQHYLRFSLPATYRRLIAVGILDDYSMGYGTVNGFRASVALPFFWYDLKSETKTPLRIHPFCFMDANAYYEEKKSAAEALQEMLAYYESIRAVNGTMIVIWHNSFLGVDEVFEGWRNAYEHFVLKACRQ
ncbi:polysaccharide deacetylase family protein [Flavisolibacter nicotianae]|uniref:polysaccharide deacetylase family protein n=1 Tax=Flavisolibacter nicotianae TaxID=2364882 RepID=UPI000EB4AF46|nr:polysaccharide deacetylase family protein [Flavisolibacter nicotianae]